MFTPVLHTSVCVADVKRVFHISRVTSHRIWVCDEDSLILTGTRGDTIHRVTDITPWFKEVGLHTVNSSDELIYIDCDDNINKLSTENKTVTRLLAIETISPWRPQCVYCSPSTGDLMVGMYKYNTGKIARYNSGIHLIQTIQHDTKGHTLFSDPRYITENNNGDIIVSDFHRVVVTDRGGRHRFSYPGPSSGSSLDPRGICTDALSHILVCDYKTNAVQMIDKDGNLLSLLLTQQHGIDRPCSLNYDDKSHLLWVGSWNTNTVSVYGYIQERYSMTGKKRGIWNVQFSSEDKVPGPSASKVKIRRKGRFLLEPDNFSNVVDMSDGGKMPSKEIKEWKHEKKENNESVRSSLSDEVPGPSALKLKIPGEASLEASITDAGLSLKHANISNNDDMPDDGETQSKEIKSWKDTSLGVSTKPFSTVENLITFNKSIEYLKEPGDVDYLNIEENPHLISGSPMINIYYREIISHLDYLDCEGLHFGMPKMPSIQSIEPFHGRSVNDFLEWMNNCKNILRKTHSTQWGSISSVLFVIYAKEAMLGFKPERLPTIIDYSMRCAIEIDNYLLAFEIVRTFLFDNVIQLQRILQSTKGTIDSVILKRILQTSRKMILRKFPILQRNNIQLSFCWDCKQKSRLVMILSYKGSIDITHRVPNEIMGFELVLYNFSQPSDEASRVFQSICVSNKTPLPTVTEDEARELFRKHSNLTMISASPYKSMGYSKGKHRTVEKLCISLFCFHKGYIPYGEEEFPKTIRTVEVDVQEGYCYFGAGRSLQSGGHIKRSARESFGSIGGFVDLPNNKVGLITCAHVVFSSEELFMLTNGKPPGANLQLDATIKVEAYDKERNSQFVCGKCTRADFPSCVQTGCPSDTNVDAALIELDQSIDTFEFWAVPSEQLKSSGFDPMIPPEFSGEIISLPEPEPVYRRSETVPNSSDIVVKYVTATGVEIGQEYRSNPSPDEVRSLSDQNPVFKVSKQEIPTYSVVKYGAVTGFTIGSLYHNPAHIRFVRENLDFPGNPGNSLSAIMCDQIEIQNLPQGQFFECGDSGSFVFCINPDKTLSCLGMAVGISPRKSCLVTPIGRVLEKLWPGAELKRCPSSVTFQGALQVILGEMNKMRSGFQTTLKDVETSIQSSLKNVHTDVQILKSKVQKLEDSNPPPSGANQN